MSEKLPEWLRPKLTQERLKEIVHYDPETGVFTRISSPYKSRVGREIGTVDTRGYVVMSLNGKVQLAHRMAWLYVYGHLPPHHLDHVNGDTTDNRIANLREATAKQNIENQKLHKNNRTGFRGVIQSKSSGRFHGHVKHHRQQIFVGSFATAEEASAAVKAKRDELYTHHRTEYSS